MNQNKTSYLRAHCKLLLFAACFIISCDTDPTPEGGRSAQFDTAPQRFNIQEGIINEASGLVASANMGGSLWTHQDSGQPASLYLISADGKSIKEYGIPGAANHDWEDVTLGPGPREGVHYIYIGDIGNNNEPVTETNTIYRIPEIGDIAGAFDGGLLEKIKFRYPDGPRDAETLLLDPLSRDIFILSKESKTGIYRLAYPQSTTEIITAEKMGTVPGLSIATSGDIAVDGAEIIVRTYAGVYYWQRKTGETVAQTLTRSATSNPMVVLEPQGEAICFDRGADGFYTLSEKGNAASVTLNYYKRK